jgi:hypothetical protein
MAYRKIEEIIVNGISGEIFGAYIYGSNLELGFSESPTKLTLNIVKETGDFDSFINTLLSSYEIKIGSLTLSKMYLYSYEISRSVGQKVATLNFLDGSFILDKIFIGLVNRHGATGDGPPTLFDVPALCLTCDGSQLLKKTGSVSRKIFSGLQVNVDPLRGGSIILGQEQFVEGACDIPDVAYNFTQLLNGITQGGINNTNFIDINPKYYQSYVGSLREVLSNWCADFGYSFYWDLTQNGLKAIDLKIEVDYINQIKNIIKSNTALGVDLTDENTLAIESFNESASLEGTVTQKFISRYLKPFKTKSSSNTSINSRSFSCIKPERFNINQNDITRSVLGKYSDNARTVFCAKNFATQGKYIGLEQIYTAETISAGQKNDNLFTKAYDYGYSNDAITQFIDKNNGAQVLIAVYNPSAKEMYANWENAIADMIGKYYQGDKEPNQETQNCQTSYFVQTNIDVSPASEVYTNKNKYDLPFADAIIGPVTNDGVSWSIPKLYIFSRSAVYGTTQEEYNAGILVNGTDPFERFIVSYLPIEGLAYSRLSAAKDSASSSGDSSTAGKLQTIISKIDELKGSGSEKKVVFAFLPPQTVLDSAISTSWSTGTNKLEIAKEEADKDSAECITQCEGDIIQDVCGKCSNPSQPYVGLKGTTARVLNVSCPTAGKSTKITLPSEAAYSGYEQTTTNLKFTVPGQKLVFGNVGSPDSNTLNLNVIESDITNDLDPADGSTILNMYVPDGANGFTKTTPAAYHADLTKKLVNSITTERKNISISVIGMKLGELESFITPDKGLTNFSINLNENGATTQIGFANRPKVLPKREAISQKVAPTIKLNTYRSK